MNATKRAATMGGPVLTVTPGATSVDDRLASIKGTVALLTVLTRALESEDDLGLKAAIVQPAWSKLSDLCATAFKDVEAVQSALADAEVSCIDDWHTALDIDAPGGAR